MGSTRRILGKVQTINPNRKPVGERLARIVARSVRFGKSIQLNQIGQIPSTHAEQALLEKYLKEIDAEEHHRTHPTKLKGLYAKVRVVRESIQLEKALGGRKPMVYHLLAKVALRHGLNSEEVKNFARTLSNISIHFKHEMTWEGLPADVYRALIHYPPHIQTNVPDGVERLLHRHPNRALTSETIARAMELNWIKPNIKLLNGTMQLLEIAKLVKKMPRASTGTEQTVWAHAAYENPPIDYPCISWDILRRLNERSQTVPEMAAPHPARFSLRADKKALYQDASIGRVMKRLQEAGLVQSLKEKREQRGLAVNMYALTPFGKELTEKSINSGHLAEALRILLIGEKTH